MQLEREYRLDMCELSNIIISYTSPIGYRIDKSELSNVISASKKKEKWNSLYVPLDIQEPHYHHNIPETSITPKK